MRLTADDLKEYGVIDEIIQEPAGGAHRAKKETVEAVGNAIFRHLTEMMKKWIATRFGATEKKSS